MIPRHYNRQKDYSRYIKIFAILCFISVIVISCITEDKVGYYLYQHPDKLEKFCPVAENDTIRTHDTICTVDTIIRIGYEESDNTAIIDLIKFNEAISCQTKLDSIAKIKQSTKVIIKNIEKVITKTDTVYINSKTTFKAAPIKNEKFYKYGFFVVSGIAIILLCLLLLWIYLLKWAQRKIDEHGKI